LRPNGLLMGFPNIVSEEEASNLCQQLAILVNGCLT